MSVRECAVCGTQNENGTHLRHLQSFGNYVFIPGENISVKLFQCDIKTSGEYFLCTHAFAYQAKALAAAEKKHSVPTK